MGSIHRSFLFILLLLLASAFSALSPALAMSIYPHYLQNNIDCDNCHDVHSTNADQPKLIWDMETPQHIDDSQMNQLCWSCHCESGSETCYETHSSRQADAGYGNWTVQCVVCHEPKYQLQALTYTNIGDYVEVGTISLSNVTETSITKTGAAWQENVFAGMKVYPNKADLFTCYKIIGNSADTLYIDPNVSTEGIDGESMDLSLIHEGDTFVISYGKLIWSPIDLGRILEYPDPGNLEAYIYPKSGTKPVKFVRTTGHNSYADADETYDGICEVCHTQTKYHHNDGSADKTHNPETRCIRCHNHQNGFMHGSGSEGCQGCHGHEAGSLYGSTMTFPNDELGGTSQGKGSVWSHSTHTEHDSNGHSDQMGPLVDDGGTLKPIYCDTCHDITNMPLFKNQDGSVGHSLAETDICNQCHSPQGTYNGVDSTLYNGVDSSVGAKDNWHTGVYNADRTLPEGKKKWCAGCHDEVPGNSQVDGLGVNAPNVIGDEDGSYTYGTGWGFYKTGHGLAEGETYPSKGGIETLSGRPVQCDSCHDLAAAHIDGVARTFDCGPAGDRLNCDQTEYRISYRLNLVDGEEPMRVPWRANSADKDATDFRLCAKCHAPGPFTDGNNTHTNFYTWSSVKISNDPLIYDNLWQNRHSYHIALSGTNSQWPADYAFDLEYNSRITCVTCHNVHGSTNLAMVRDGKLIGREPGLEIWYGDENTVPTGTAGSWLVMPPIPENVTLADSIGTYWGAGSSVNLCSYCHLNGRFDKRCEPVDIIGDDPDLGLEPDDCSSYVPPFQTSTIEPPALEWTGENGYVSDGVEPDIGTAGSTFIFRVKYTDIYNYAPWTIQLWIDKDDDGTYENLDGDPADEKIDLVALDPYDDDYTNGKLYIAAVTLDKVGDNSLTYRFHTLGAWEDEVELPALPGPDPEVAISNNPPVLTWTGEQYFETDGVHPNVGGLGSDYQFRVMYSDPEGECPSSIQVWIDFDNDGYENGGSDKLPLNAGTGDCGTGKLYYSDSVTFSAGGDYTYRFYAYDGFDEATADAGPVSGNTVTVQASVNSPPQLDWVTEPCLTDGVKPALGLATGDFEFKVRYTDPDGDTPTSVMVWVDLNDNDMVEAGEEQILTWIDDGDEDYTDGEVFAYTLSIDEVDAGEHEFIFSAGDGTDVAVGEPTEADPSRTVTVVSTANAIGVRQGLAGYADPWYETIQDGIDPYGSEDPNARTTILVYDGTYNENIVLDRFGFPRDNNITLQSVCGPELTVIQGRDDDDNDEPDANAVSFYEIINPVIDGFTITGGIEGIELFHSSPLVKNCIIEGNNRGIKSGNDIGHLAMENTIIQNNVGTSPGAGIYLYGGSYQHTISGCVIKNNQSTEGFGGGIYLVNSRIDKGLAIENTTISGNTASGSGGGINITRSVLDLEKVTLSANSAGSGGGLFVKENSLVNMTNSNVVDNIADSGGGGIAIWSANDPGDDPGKLIMSNCTVSSNSLSDPETGDGGGLSATGGWLYNVSINNSIFWNNRAGNGHEVSNKTPGTISFTWSDVLGDSHALSGAGTITTDANCIEADPFFVDSGSGDYHLKSISPCIDAGGGVDDLDPDPPIDDFEGDPRPTDGPDGDTDAEYDMGHDEYVPVP